MSHEPCLTLDDANAWAVGDRVDAKRGRARGNTVGHPGSIRTSVPAGSSKGTGSDSIEFGGRFRSAVAAYRRRLAEGSLPFVDVCHDSAALGEVMSLVGRFQEKVDDVVVIGIGGSALGTRALRDALLGPASNYRSGSRGSVPRLHVVDNPDPDVLAPLLERIDLDRTLFNVVSKSGSTVETLAIYLVVRSRVEQARGEEAVRERFVFTTDPDKGALREIAGNEGITALPVPNEVGGRFSVLTPVGLFPLALAGVQVDAILAGALRAFESCGFDEAPANPAATLAAHLHRLDEDGGRRVQLLMPYGDRLAPCARFFQQLWAESLGKRPDRGATPIAAYGPADQHSILQLLVEGPADKAVIFLESQSDNPELTVPKARYGRPETDRLSGWPLKEIVSIERRATAEALARTGCPNLTILLSDSLLSDSLSGNRAQAMGEFVAVVQASTVMAADLYGVDPYGQPGVEGVKLLVNRYLETGRFPLGGSITQASRPN